MAAPSRLKTKELETATNQSDPPELSDQLSPLPLQSSLKESSTAHVRIEPRCHTESPTRVAYSTGPLVASLEEDAADDLQPRPRSRVISRPRITLSNQEEDEVDSEEEWDTYLSTSAPAPAPAQRSVRDSTVLERAANPIRSLVSRQKKRFINSRYDLDLSYVTGNIIAMGFPSEGAESVYRNKMSIVQSFLEEYHSAKYRVYNLCSEKVYPATKFKNRLGYYPFDDHRCPSLLLVEAFCRDVHHWLRQHEDNVAVVHCKAGKGRTGCLICCYIVYSKLCLTAKDAIEFFGAQRTHDGKGVTIPSQLRYIEYTEQVVSSPRLCFSDAPSRVLTQVIMVTIPSFDPTGGCNPYFVIYLNGDEVFSTRKGDEPVPKVRASRQRDVTWQCHVTIRADMYMEFYDYDKLGNNEVMFGVGLHTTFIEGENYTFKREELDGASKKKKTFSKDFALKLKFAAQPSNGTVYVSTNSISTPVLPSTPTATSLEATNTVHASSPEPTTNCHATSPGATTTIAPTSPGATATTCTISPGATTALTTSSEATTSITIPTTSSGATTASTTSPGATTAPTTSPGATTAPTTSSEATATTTTIATSAPCSTSPEAATTTCATSLGATTNPVLVSAADSS